MKHVKHVDHDVVLEDWTIGVVEEFSASLSETIKKGIAQVIAYGLESGDAYAYFPIEWGWHDGMGGTPPDDPLTVYLNLPFGDIDKNPAFSFSLSDAVLQSIDLNRSRQSGQVEGGLAIENLSKMSAALRASADAIDAALLK